MIVLFIFSMASNYVRSYISSILHTNCKMSGKLVILAGPLHNRIISDSFAEILDQISSEFNRIQNKNFSNMYWIPTPFTVVDIQLMIRSATLVLGRM
jgi:hypothetical protein